MNASSRRRTGGADPSGTAGSGRPGTDHCHGLLSVCTPRDPTVTGLDLGTQPSLRRTDTVRGIGPPSAGTASYDPLCTVLPLFHIRAIALSVGLLCAAGPFVSRAYADMQRDVLQRISLLQGEPPQRRERPHRAVGCGSTARPAVQGCLGADLRLPSRMKITLPQGKVFDDFSSLHEGCNPNGEPAKDNHTGGEFRKIGSQRL